LEPQPDLRFNEENPSPDFLVRQAKRQELAMYLDIVMNLFLAILTFLSLGLFAAFCFIFHEDLKS
jgi:hypothetical protein